MGEVRKGKKGAGGARTKYRLLHLPPVFSNKRRPGRKEGGDGALASEEGNKTQGLSGSFSRKILSKESRGGEGEGRAISVGPKGSSRETFLRGLQISW